MVLKSGPDRTVRPEKPKIGLKFGFLSLQNRVSVSCERTEQTRVQSKKPDELQTGSTGHGIGEILDSKGNIGFRSVNAYWIGKRKMFICHSLLPPATISAFSTSSRALAMASNPQQHQGNAQSLTENKMKTRTNQLENRTKETST